MSEAKFTIGEWNVNYKGYSTGVGVVCGGKEIHWCIETPETIANAHLIASAPEMYAMLEDLSELLEALSHEDTYLYNKAKIASDNVDELLAKARGES